MNPYGSIEVSLSKDKYHVMLTLCAGMKFEFRSNVASAYLSCTSCMLGLLLLLLSWSWVSKVLFAACMSSSHDNHVQDHSTRPLPYEEKQEWLSLFQQPHNGKFKEAASLCGLQCVSACYYLSPSGWTGTFSQTRSKADCLPRKFDNQRCIQAKAECSTLEMLQHDSCFSTSPPRLKWYTSLTLSK